MNIFMSCSKFWRCDENLTCFWPMSTFATLCLICPCGFGQAKQSWAGWKQLLMLLLPYCISSHFTVEKYVCVADRRLRFTADGTKNYGWIVPTKTDILCAPAALTQPRTFTPLKNFLTFQVEPFDKRSGVDPKLSEYRIDFKWCRRCLCAPDIPPRLLARRLMMSSAEMIQLVIATSPSFVLTYRERSLVGCVDHVT